MRKLGLGVLLAVLATVGTASTVSAAIGDFRVGTYTGTWCGVQNVQFNITSREGNDWIFDGTIFFPGYNQYDPVRIEQYSDNSLHMVRSLTGPGAGQTQTVDTYAPTLRDDGRGRYSYYASQSSSSPDCQGLNDTFLAVPE